jgi:selenide,water dikinase
LKGLRLDKSPDLLVGSNTLDDAAVFRLGAGLAVVSTVDFFTPVVDSPLSYGRISAANAMSDVYAMGGRPILALNILCLPEATLSHRVVREILKGGEEKVREAGAYLGGGHSVKDPELKYGLCVTGIVRPDEVVRNSGARVGDDLFLTKPLGIGLMTTGIKYGLLPRGAIRRVTLVMEELNGRASEAMVKAGASACTDITGFGLLGHALEVAEASHVTMELDFASIPVMPEAYEMLDAEAIPGGLWTNKSFVRPRVALKGVTDREMNILCDPQTSGGLLISVPRRRAEKLAGLLARGGVAASRIGKVLAKGDGAIIVSR